MTTNDKFFNTINEYSMLSPGDDVLVGFSGGADSTCLLSLLYENKDVLGITVRAAHVNHGLRGEEADRDELFVRKFCGDRNIPLAVLRTDVGRIAKDKGISTELAGRDVRYSFFESLSASKTATAHTGSDAAETLLMNIARGASLRGLCSIPPVRGGIIRPLINLTREETEKYCIENGLQYVTDSTNSENAYTRNKFRNNVVGEIKKIEPGFEQAALRCINSVRIENDFIERIVNEYYTERSADGKLQINDFSSIHKAIRLRLLARYIAEAVGADYEERHLRLLDDNLEVVGYAVTLPGGRAVRTDGRFLSPVPEKITALSEEEIFINKTGLNNELSFNCYNGYNIDFKISTERSGTKNEVDFSKTDDVIIIRSRREGDKITLAGRNCTKTLKKLFNELKIPVALRDRIPVVADKNGIIYVHGAGIDASRAAGPQTERILIINTEKVKNE